MAFLRLFYIQAIVLVILSIYSIEQASAQVGGVLACTNFTCRYGECEQLENRFICHCPDGVKGENCDRKMQPGDDMCLSSPCWGGGTCQNLGNDFRCICPAGRSGKNCRTIDSAPCLYQNPCRNNAVCRVDSTNTYYCFCVGLWTGRYCETPVQLCSRPNPCFNGGTCVNNACRCPFNFTGVQCETFKQPNTDKIVKILNKGGYVADLFLNYQLQDSSNQKYNVQQRGRIAIHQEFIFYVPNAVNYDGASGVYLVVEAILGKRVVATRIGANPECFHVWGTTLIPFWSRMPCW